MKFSEIQLHPILQANIDRLQFSECTKIQEQALPLIRQGKDVAGLAQTGTGKTGAFFIPLIDRLLKAQSPDEGTADSPTAPFTDWKRKQFVLVLVPTRELAEQVQEISGKLLEGTNLRSVSVYGGTTYEKQIAALKDGVEFVIATPGRLIDLYKEHVCDLGLVRAIVFDEADRMFDMGFKEDMKFILKRVPRERQFTVFSATLNFDVLAVAYEFGSDPIEINISRDQPKAENVKDSILHVGQIDKPGTLLSIIKKHEPRQAIIFSNFKHSVERLTNFLNANKIPAVGISSLMTQAQRLRVMEQFKGDNDRNILVATDLAARGLDILGVDLIINFELPDDPENYVHRIGRTGRAGQTGTALSLVSDRDVDALQRIEEYLKHKVDVVWLDDAEILKEFAPFPRDESRFKRPGQDRGGRSSGGGERDRGGGGRGGPRRDRPGGDRDRGGERPASAVGGVSVGAEGSASAGGADGARRDSGPRRESHRDRASGRHREPGESADAPAGAPGPRREGREPREAREPREPRDSREPREAREPRDGREPHDSREPRDPRRRERGGRGRGRGRSDGDRAGSADGRPPQSGSGPRRDHSPRAAGSAGGNRPAPRSGPSAGRKPDSGIGSKVTGFFKKLFGG